MIHPAPYLTALSLPSDAPAAGPREPGQYRRGPAEPVLSALAAPLAPRGFLSSECALVPGRVIQCYV